MTLHVGYHILPGGEPPPEVILPAATFLDLAPTMGMKSQERLVRPYVTGAPPYQEMAQKASSWFQQGVKRVQILNEPNLPNEGFQGGPAAYADYFMRVAAHVPAVKCYYAGMSPGMPDWKDWYTGVNIEQIINNFAAGLVVHAYGDDWLMRSIVTWIHEKFPDKLLWIGECNFGAGQTVDRNVWANAQLLPFLDWCNLFPRIEAVTYFAYRWPDPDMLLSTPVDAEGTLIQKVIGGWTPLTEPPVPTPTPTPLPLPSPPVLTPTKNPWAGKILTVHNLPITPAQLVEIGVALRVDGFEIKVADGDSQWGPTRLVTPEYVKTLRDAGFRVLGWSYNYCDGKAERPNGGGGGPENEADAILRAIETLELDGHTCDLEAECEGHGDFVEIMLNRLRTGVPDDFWIAAHTWADLRGHETYPAETISTMVDVLRPMIYRPIWNAERSWESWAPYYYDKIVCPVWGITESLLPDLRADMEYADTHQIPGEAYWESQAARNLGVAMRELIVNRSFGTPGPVEPPDQSVAFDIVAMRQHLWDMGDALEREGYPWFAASIKAAVAQNKGER